jgi:hypothetical protein
LAASGAKELYLTGTKAFEILPAQYSLISSKFASIAADRHIDLFWYTSTMGLYAVLTGDPNVSILEKFCLKPLAELVSKLQMNFAHTLRAIRSSYGFNGRPLVKLIWICLQTQTFCSFYQHVLPYLRTSKPVVTIC